MRNPIGAALCVAAALAAIPALADGPAPFPDFNAKRVKPPKPGTRHRITVQIAPKPEPAKPAVAPAPAAQPAPAAPSGKYAWFWDKVSPELSATGPGRLDPALQTLASPPEGKAVAAPRLQQLQQIVHREGKRILGATVGTQVSPALVLAVIAVESSGRADAVSSAGAQGLMQLMPDTATRFGVTDSLSAPDNIRGGVAFLDLLMKKFAGDPILVLAGYNAGENSIGKFGGVPPFAETRDYVPKVLEAFRTASALCKTPPMLVSDGCVFAVE